MKKTIITLGTILMLGDTIAMQDNNKNISSVKIEPLYMSMMRNVSESPRPEKFNNASLNIARDTEVGRQTENIQSINTTSSTSVSCEPEALEPNDVVPLLKTSCEPETLEPNDMVPSTLVSTEIGEQVENILSVNEDLLAPVSYEPEISKQDDVIFLSDEESVTNDTTPLKLSFKKEKRKSCFCIKPTIFKKSIFFIGEKIVKLSSSCVKSKAVTEMVSCVKGVFSRFSLRQCFPSRTARYQQINNVEWSENTIFDSEEKENQELKETEEN
ncbi:MAG: hypothetical protein LBB29_02650 [Holosporaceae bacterium]|jgi:hypothetical protein|nr:hypothetical protein [Holosporaceae bacterium]